MLKLAAQFVKSVKTTGARREILDADVRGLALRVTPSGVKSWCFRYQRLSDRRKRNVTLGSYPDYSLDAARNWGTQLRAAVARGEDPAGGKQARKRAETFLEVCAQWAWRHARKKNPKTRRRKMTPLGLKRAIRMLRRDVLPELGSMKIGEIAKRDVIAVLDRVASRPDARFKNAKTGRSMSHQANRTFELTRSIFKWAVGRDLLKVDPTAGIKPPVEEEAPRERALEPDEIRRLWLALDKAPAVRTRLPDGTLPPRKPDDFPMRRATAIAVQLALVTGQRVGEVTGIPDEELDLASAEPLWTIPPARAKNKRGHTVSLSPLAVRLIREARELAGDSRWLFPNARGDGPMESTAPVKALGRAEHILGLGEIRVHDMRRTMTTQMQKLGILPIVVAHILNHISVTKATVTSRHYGHYDYSSEKRAALIKWAKRLEAIVAGKLDETRQAA
jgi:integrase